MIEFILHVLFCNAAGCACTWCWRCIRRRMSAVRCDTCDGRCASEQEMRTGICDSCVARATRAFQEVNRGAV